MANSFVGSSRAWARKTLAKVPAPRNFPLTYFAAMAAFMLSARSSESGLPLLIATCLGRVLRIVRDFVLTGPAASTLMFEGERG